MYFDTLNAALYMDGHGAYVWSAYLITALVLAGILVLPLRRQRNFLQRLAGDIRRQQGARAPSGEQ